jgi:hypothetical protein|tara:strand:+ start:62 stop:304 length:243 start_codon:yes stop_codon:yes gene_type:complete
MKVTAEVTIGNGTYEGWLEFFNSYKSERNQFVSNEVIEKVSANSAVVTFDIVNLEGLTKLSSREDIIETEKRMQITTAIK